MDPNGRHSRPILKQPVSIFSIRTTKTPTQPQRCKGGTLATYSGQVCPVFIPTRHTSEASEDASLHRVHIACATLRGRDGGSLLQLFRDTLSAIYENIITLDSVEAFQI